MAYFLQQTVNGLHPAALYALLAYGYALVFGVTHRASFVQGALFAFAGQMVILGAVFAYLHLWLGLAASLAFGVVAAVVLTLGIADLLARRVFAALALASPNTFIAATLGAMIVLMELGRIAADTRDWWLPPVMAGPLVLADIGGYVVSLTRLQVAGIGLSALAIAAAEWSLERSPTGRIWRAVCDDPFAAALTGVNERLVIVRSAVTGAAFATLAGVLAALHYGNVSFGTGLIYGLKVIFIAALGNGTPRRAALGAAAVGMAEAQWTAWFPADWRDGAILAGLCLLLIVRPRGRTIENT